MGRDLNIKVLSAYGSWVDVPFYNLVIGRHNQFLDDEEEYEPEELVDRIKFVAENCDDENYVEVGHALMVYSFALSECKGCRIRISYC